MSIKHVGLSCPDGGIVRLRHQQQPRAHQLNYSRLSLSPNIPAFPAHSAHQHRPEAHNPLPCQPPHTTSMAPTTKGLVLVTGANGYIAARVVEAFLEAGYSVRGTVRSEASGKGLLEALPTYAADGRLELALVPDIVKEGAFDEAVKGELF